MLQLESDPICGSAGCDQHLKKEKKTHPMDYFVPNFGKSPEINDVNQSLEAAQEQLNHQWSWKLEKKKPLDPPTLYNYHPELDADMKATANHLGWAEQSTGQTLDADELMQSHHSHKKHIHHKIHSLAQSDPISGSAGWPERKGKKAAAADVEYPNPDTMELEPDMVDSAAHLKATEKTLGRKWVWDDDEDRGLKWLNDQDTWGRSATPTASTAETDGLIAAMQKSPSNEPVKAGPVQDQHGTSQEAMVQKDHHHHHHKSKKVSKKAKKAAKNSGCPFA